MTDKVELSVDANMETSVGAIRQLLSALHAGEHDNDGAHRQQYSRCQNFF
jgi:hypothetical protein